MSVVQPNSINVLSLVTSGDTDDTKETPKITPSNAGQLIKLIYLYPIDSNLSLLSFVIWLINDIDTLISVLKAVH